MKQEARKVIVGQEELFELVAVGFLSGGHVLLEGVPGTAKTLLAKTLAMVVSGEFSRVQFTPDLMPSDIVRHQRLRSDDAPIQPQARTGFHQRVAGG